MSPKDLVQKLQSLGHRRLAECVDSMLRANGALYNSCADSGLIRRSKNAAGELYLAIYTTIERMSIGAEITARAGADDRRGLREYAARLEEQLAEQRRLREEYGFQKEAEIRELKDQLIAEKHKPQAFHELAMEVVQLKRELAAAKARGDEHKRQKWWFAYGGKGDPPPARVTCDERRPFSSAISTFCVLPKGHEGRCKDDKGNMWFRKKQCKHCGCEV